jgi:hypothetical protein
MARGPGRIKPKAGKLTRKQLQAALRASARKQHELEQRRRADRAKTNQTAVTAEPNRPGHPSATNEDYLKFFDDQRARDAKFFNDQRAGAAHATGRRQDLPQRPQRKR